MFFSFSFFGKNIHTSLKLLFYCQCLLKLPIMSIFLINYQNNVNVPIKANKKDKNNLKFFNKTKISL
jgi:hypothetical protein